LVTGLGICSHIVHRDQSLNVRCGCLFFRIGAAGGLRRELSLSGGLRENLLLTVYMKKQLATFIS